MRYSNSSNERKPSENGIIDKFYLMADTSCGQSTLNSLLHRKCIISINGKDSIPNWNW